MARRCLAVAVRAVAGAREILRLAATSMRPLCSVRDRNERINPLLQGERVPAVTFPEDVGCRSRPVADRTRTEKWAWPRRQLRILSAEKASAGRTGRTWPEQLWSLVRAVPYKAARVSPYRDADGRPLARLSPRTASVGAAANSGLVGGVKSTATLMIGKVCFIWLADWRRETGVRASRSGQSSATPTINNDPSPPEWSLLHFYRLRITVPDEHM